MTPFEDITEYLTNNQEITQKITSFVVINHIKEIISSCIKGLRTKNMTHKEIGEIFKISKGLVFRIEKMEYFPKKESKQMELLKIALENL